MEPTRTTEGVRIGEDARQRLHQARGYGRPIGDADVLVTPVEAAYLLFRGDIESVDGDAFDTFVSSVRTDRFLTRYLVYKDLRERGFYLRPSRSETSFDFSVFERGTHPADGKIAYEVRAVDEREVLEVTDLEPGVLALVDEEGEVGFVEIETYEPEGSTPAELAPVDGDLIGNRVVVWEPPATLYQEAFFGQPIAGREDVDGPVQLGLVEACYLAEAGALSANPATIRERGRDIEGTERFDRRASVYRALREAGTVPKTGFKFGADFRVYHAFGGLDDMGHSAVLVRTLDRDGHIDPSEVALDVRLAHGVGKRMVFAITSASDTTTISWLSVTRVTP